MTTTRLSEDDIYRTSTQYRLWSYSQPQLADQRRKTHDLALTRARQHAGHENDGSDNRASTGMALTEEEELRLVQRHCQRIRTTCETLQWPISVKGTAVQYLKRFYLSNSCMTYPPAEIYKTAMFLATKTEAIHLTVGKFSASINADPDAVLAPEYKLMQALRFTLDVRHPFRGLKGALMELLNMAEGLTGTLQNIDQKSGKELQESMMAIKGPAAGCRTRWRIPSSAMTRKDLVERVQQAYEAAKGLVDMSASLTDAYFLYTPSQILLAALHLADEPLTSFYLDTKLPTSSPTRPKILATIESCATVLGSFDPNGLLTREEALVIEQKLDRCRDPTTKDLVKSHAAMKRNGAGDGKTDEDKAKRRKLEREKNSKEMDDLFGPSLKAGGNG